jgi:acylphosphatase
MTVRKRLLVSGRVQGVFFRDTCRRVASEAGVAGWASNLPDGRVEVVVEGDPGSVEAVVRWCHEGTPYSRVESVEVAEEKSKGASGFAIR